MVSRLAKAMDKSDVNNIFLLGDYSDGFKDAKENARDIDSILDILSPFKVWAIPGNCDQRDSLVTFAKIGVNLHKNVVMFDNTQIIGIGGSNPTPFGTPFELSEDEIKDALNALEDRCKEGVQKVIMSHFPPYGTKCDYIGGGKHVGSKALSAHIRRSKPDIVLCSHIHECGRVNDRVDDTIIQNLGRISDGVAYLVDTKGGVTVKPVIDDVF